MSKRYGKVRSLAAVLLSLAILLATMGAEMPVRAAETGGTLKVTSVDTGFVSEPDTLSQNWRIRINVSGTWPATEGWHGYDCSATAPAVVGDKNGNVSYTGTSDTVNFYQDGTKLYLIIWGAYTNANKFAEGDTISVPECTLTLAEDTSKSVKLEKALLRYNGERWLADTGASGGTVLYSKVTLSQVSPASSISGGEWSLYPVPEKPSEVPGTPWQTKFLDVEYEVDGVPYKTDAIRANNSEGLYMKIPGTALDPAASNSLLKIKKGKYASSDGSYGIEITEDFLIVVSNGSFSTEFDPSGEQYTGTVRCNLDVKDYVVTDAQDVQIDGETYHMGDTYGKIGTHTLTYSLYGYDIERKLVCYRYGDTDVDGMADLADLLQLKKHLANAIVLTDAGSAGADINCDDVIDSSDVRSLKAYLLTMDLDMILILSPDNGQTVAQPSAEVAKVTENYKEKVTEDMMGKTDRYYRSPVRINWMARAGVTTYQVTISKKQDLSDPLLYTTDVPSLEVNNLLPDTTYYWNIKAGDSVSATRSFHTAATVRTLTIGGVSNTRDAGGYQTTDGKRVKYGMLYRGGKLNDITEDGLREMNEILHIRTDMDLRTPGEGGAGQTSPLGTDVIYMNYDAPWYWTNCSNAKYKDALKQEIQTFADPDNFPIYVHCSLGRDRTGTLIILINGLLGVSQKDLAMDYELSFLSAVCSGDTTVTYMMSAFHELCDQVQKYAPNGTFADACEEYMEQYLGITQSEIDAIRSNMLE